VCKEASEVVSEVANTKVIHGNLNAISCNSSDK